MTPQDHAAALARHRPEGQFMEAATPGSPENVALITAAAIDQLRGDVRAVGLDELDRALEKAFVIAERESKDNGI